MQKTIPFKKDILFKNAIEEITSIGIVHDLKIEASEIVGSFTISGEYKYATGADTFNFDIPYSCYIEDNYDTSDALTDIEDFYYEMIGPNKLAVSIEIKVDNLKEKPLLSIEEVIELPVEEQEEERIDIIDTPIFEQTKNTQEDYVTYKIYIVREGDTIQSILEKYEITNEQLLKYNVINDLNKGDKIIIPYEKVK